MVNGCFQTQNVCIWDLLNYRLPHPMSQQEDTSILLYLWQKREADEYKDSIKLFTANSAFWYSKEYPLMSL